MKSPLGSIAKGVTFGVNSRSNVKALMLCLSSVLLSPVAPQILRIRLEGEFPGFGEFYLEQISEIARLRGVELSLHPFKSSGTRKARQWQLETCVTEWLWMADDDCLYVPHCLQEFLKAMKIIYDRNNLQTGGDTLGFISGCKVDVNNRRGYMNFDMEVHSHNAVVEGCSHNHLYESGDNTPRAHLLDTGNVFLNVAPLRKRGVTFDPFGDSPNASGEDTLFALQARKQQLLGFLAPNAIALHLEKPAGGFNEFTARAEMLSLACKLRGLDETVLREEFMPGIYPA